WGRGSSAACTRRWAGCPRLADSTRLGSAVSAVSLGTPGGDMSGHPYVVITADSHAGASVETYRDYLDEKHKKLFDEWRGTYRNPQQKHIGSKKHKNWDDAERMTDMQAEGIAGEV